MLVVCLFVLLPIELVDNERDQLEAWSRPHSGAQWLAVCSRIVLAAGEGVEQL